MAGAKPTLNPLTDTPKNKTEVTKPYMYAFMESEKASLEDVEWFYELISKPENRKMYKNKFKQSEDDPDEYEDIDIPKVREAFCARFYPNLNVKNKGPRTFTDKIEALRAKKMKQASESK